VPAAYEDGTKAPILVIHDGPGQLKLVRNALDNLTISKDPKRKLPAFIAIAVENGGDDGKNSERGLEYDTMSDRLARFIHDEVLPAVLNNAEIKAAYPKFALTDNPWGRAVLGCSSGGAAALTMGWFRPDLFRRLIAYSGTFVDQQDDDAAEEAKYPLGAWEYHSSMKLIENSEKKPLRIFTHVSENDLRPKDPEETHHNWVMAGERTAAALKAKGYNHRSYLALPRATATAAFSSKHWRIRSCGCGAATTPTEPHQAVQAGAALLCCPSTATLDAMSSVVFFRAVNVGGHQKFQPGELAKELAEFGVVNIGAAGTFVVRENVSQAKLRDEILHRLRFKPELMICPAREVLELVRGNWFGDVPAGKDIGRFVSVLQKAPRAKPALPIKQPAGANWEVWVVAITGRFVLSIRRFGRTYSNAFVEKHLGIPATTRNWNTIEVICEVLEKQS